MKELEEKCLRCGGRVSVVVRQGKYMLITGGPTYRVQLQATVSCAETSLDYCGWSEKSTVIEAIFEFGD